MFGGWSQGERNDVQLCDLAAPTEADDAARVWGPGQARAAEELVCGADSAVDEESEESDDEWGWGGGMGGGDQGQQQLVMLSNGQVRALRTQSHILIPPACPLLSRLSDGCCRANCRSCRVHC